MKYEMIFGDEKLFDGAPECATHATKGGGFYYVDSGIVKFISNMFFGARDVCGLAGYLVAERRIIKEPKRWTWEDKKAGVLPEVGAKCSHCHSVDERTVLLVTDKYVGIERDNSDMNPYFVTHAEFLHYYIPIETPEEKAARLREEWCNRAMDYSTIQQLYDALLSGELPMPKKGGE